MEDFLSLLLTFAVVIVEGLSIVFGWIIDHFFEIAVLYALFFGLPRCILSSRADPDNLEELTIKLNELVELVEELNNKFPEPEYIDSDLEPDDITSDYDYTPQENSGKPTKPYPY